MIKFQLFPRSRGLSPEMENIVACFKNNADAIDSTIHDYESNDVLEIVRPDLEKINFRIEKGKTKNALIQVPVLFGENNNPDKFFNADGVSQDGKIVLEVEAGRGYVNNQFLKDIFQACMMYEVEYLVLAVRNKYKSSDDFKKIYTFLETLYISNRLQLPLKGILLIGY